MFVDLIPLKFLRKYFRIAKICPVCSIINESHSYSQKIFLGSPENHYGLVQ